MNILISNDDGIFSEGIRALAEALAPHHHITVVAPEMQQSGMSHASTFLEPVRVRPVTLQGLPNIPAYATRGTPADCVRLGCSYLGVEPDLVVTGINHGANVGTHVLYSGTVGAAMEAALSGKPAIATSCCNWQPKDFSAAAQATLWAVEYVEKHPLPPYMILNLNTPDMPISEIKGLKLTGLYIHEYDDQFVHFQDPYGRDYYWMTMSDKKKPDETMENDYRWVHEGYATLTPIHCDITAYQYMQDMDITGFDIRRKP